MESITNWASGIIVAVIIATLIEMIIPDNKNKKYIKTIIGIYVLFTIISPVISNGLTNGEIDISKYEKYFEHSEGTNTLVSDLEITNNSNIYNIYKKQLEEDIKLKLRGKGYKVNEIKMQIKEQEKNYGEIEKITLIVEVLEENQTKESTNKNEVTIININKIEIGTTLEQKQEENKMNLTQKQQTEIKEYLKEEYGIKEECIYFK